MGPAGGALRIWRYRGSMLGKIRLTWLGQAFGHLALRSIDQFKAKSND